MEKPLFWRPLLFLTGATALILLFDLDRRFQRLFFSEADGWALIDHPLAALLYDYGTWPAIGLSAAALVVCLTSLAARRWRRWFRPALFLVLVMGLGPGLIVNALFKANFGRPRPNSIQEFGRQDEFLPLFQKGIRKRGASFPSGHASMGFYLMAPYFILLARRRRLAKLLLVTGIAAGSAVGLARIGAGDHFVGDVLWSWGFVYFSGLACYYLLRFDKEPVEPTGPGQG